MVDSFLSPLLADIAIQAAILEASLSPKPGLVCPDTQGAHKDMDITTMVAGALSLHDYFLSCTEHGKRTANRPAVDVFPHLRELGKIAERTMLEATQGINTHKGLIFSLGLLTAATARQQYLEHPTDCSSTCAVASQFIAGITRQDFSCLSHLKEKAMLQLHQNLSSQEQACAHVCNTMKSPLVRWAVEDLQRPLSAGERLYLLYGITGIRGEAEQGFPHLVSGKQHFDFWLQTSDFSSAAINTLLFFIANTEDTNVLHRGGKNGLTRLQQAAQRALSYKGILTEQGRQAINNMQSFCLEHSLSPGGCADLLACVLYFHLFEKKKRSHT